MICLLLFALADIEGTVYRRCSSCRNKFDEVQLIRVVEYDLLLCGKCFGDFRSLEMEATQ